MVRLPNGKRESFTRPPPPYREPATPLCSDNGGRIPCWVKPPADAAKAAVDDVASQLTIGHDGVDFNKAVEMLRDKGIDIGGNITYVGR